MHSAEYDLRYLKAGIDDLEEYLLANDLYWPVQISAPHGQPPYPQITPGNLLLARQRLEASAQSGGEQAQLQTLDAKFHSIITQWRSAWEKKCRKDVDARLRLWGDFINDYRENPRANLDRYAYEVTRRVQIQLMQPYVAHLEGGEAELLGTMDKLLRAVLQPGGFVWEAPLEPAFPNPPFWYLFGRLKSNGTQE